MAASAWVLHDKAKLYEGDGTIDYTSDAFKAFLVTSASNLATTSINAFSTVTNELSTANGYTAGGVAVGSVTWTESGGTVTLDCADAVWTAAGGSLTARLGGLYDDTVASPVVDPVVAHSLLDDTPADVVATDTNTFTIAMNATGVFTKA